LASFSIFITIFFAPKEVLGFGWIGGGERPTDELGRIILSPLKLGRIILSSLKENNLHHFKGEPFPPERIMLASLRFICDERRRSGSFKRENATGRKTRQEKTSQLY